MIAYLRLSITYLRHITSARRHTDWHWGLISPCRYFPGRVDAGNLGLAAMYAALCFSSRKIRSLLCPFHVWGASCWDRASRAMPA